MRKLNECKLYLVSYPLGREEMKECMLACLAASMTSSMFTSLLLSPYWMFSAIVRSNRVGSLQTICILYFTLHSMYSMMDTRLGHYLYIEKLEAILLS